MGAAAIVQSNMASGGAVSGEAIGTLLPGVLQSLQEGADAAMSANLYYPESVGSFNYPSFQRSFGVLNQTFSGFSKFGESSNAYIPRDIFWKGPAMLKFRVEIPYRFMGGIIPYNGYNADPVRVRPQIFYSWGAGYAAVSQVKFDLGGAGQYILDRYANFIGIMASCFSHMQRMALMKISGGGVIAETPGVETCFGIAGSTAEYSAVQNFTLTGQQVQLPVDQQTNCNVFRTYSPVFDNWVVALKTPHTNFNNPRVQYKPFDTNLTGSQFWLNVSTAKITEFVDTGVGLAPVPVKDHIIPPTPGVHMPDPTLGISFLEHFRQYDNYYGDSTKSMYLDSFMTGASNSTQISLWSGSMTGDFNVLPTRADLETLGYDKSQPMDDNTTPYVSLTTVISSLRLTNPLLGALSVLEGRLDQAVYYPFQHLTTQTYFVRNGTWQGLKMSEVIDMSHPEFSKTIQDRTMTNVKISIPVNPLTVMYVMVLREKDRIGTTLSKAGAYTPSLFWNGLNLPKYELKYGMERLYSVESSAELICDQIYEHCTPISVPYKGGFCTRSEALSSIGMTMTAMNGTPNPFNTLNGTNIFGGRPDSGGGLYHGVLRNSYIYEFPLVEHSPMAREDIFQQTPSFEGEELNFNFVYEPFLTATQHAPASFNPMSDFSYLDNWLPLETQGQNELSSFYRMRDCQAVKTSVSGPLVGAVNDVYKGIPNELIGVPGAPNAWVLNNDNLMVVCVYAQNALWQLNPTMSKLVFARG